MSDAVDSVVAAARRSGLLAAGQPVVVLLSGGRDSVCLVDVAVTLAGAGAVSALHVNYGLREAAEADERHCTAVCATLSVPLRVERPRPPEAGNVQAWAREVRYRAGESEAERRGGVVAAGHTASDQAETILYRLAASPGRRALLGMRPCVGRLVRPLLEVSRGQTAAYCEARGLSWCEDETNLDDRYARGRVRGGLLPALRAIHPAAEANVVRTARLLREEAEVLDALVEAEVAADGTVATARLAVMPPAVGRLVVLRLAEDAAGRPVPDAGRRLEEIVALAQRRREASLDLGGGVRVLISDGRLRFAAGAPPSGWRRWRAARSARPGLRTRLSRRPG